MHLPGNEWDISNIRSTSEPRIKKRNDPETILNNSACKLCGGQYVPDQWDKFCLELINTRFTWLCLCAKPRWYGGFNFRNHLVSCGRNLVGSQREVSNDRSTCPRTLYPVFSPHPLQHTPLPPAEGWAGLHVASGLTACVQQAHTALGDMILAWVFCGQFACSLLGGV